MKKTNSMPPVVLQSTYVLTRDREYNFMLISYRRKANASGPGEEAQCSFDQDVSSGQHQESQSLSHEITTRSFCLGSIRFHVSMMIDPSRWLVTFERSNRRPRRRQTRRSHHLQGCLPTPSMKNGCHDPTRARLGIRRYCQVGRCRHC